MAYGSTRTPDAKEHNSLYGELKGAKFWWKIDSRVISIFDSCVTNRVTKLGKRVFVRIRKIDCHTLSGHTGAFGGLRFLTSTCDFWAESSLASGNWHRHLFRPPLPIYFFVSSTFMDWGGSVCRRVFQCITRKTWTHKNYRSHRVIQHFIDCNEVFIFSTLCLLTPLLFHWV